ncbi:MAG: DUF448 domain-containing protein [Myxococcales bacterium]|nr:MAG: DUF448 domain-containing protein [Myxococcales bacterium]
MGRRTPESAPQRTCVGCGRIADQGRLVRLVLSPEGSVELDYGDRLGGRGAWLCPRRDCFELAKNGRGFARSFRARPRRYEPDRLWEILARVNRERLREAVRLAQKAGAIVHGANNVEAALNRPDLRLIFLAEDASANTVDAFRRAAAARGLAVAQALTMEELGAALGKESRAVLGVTHPAFSGRLVRECWIYASVENRPEWAARELDEDEGVVWGSGERMN